MYDFRTNNPRGLLGINLFKTFQKFIELKIAFRQSSDSHYASLLDRLALGQITKHDYDLLCERSTGVISPLEMKTFSNAVHICATREVVKKRHHQYLDDMKYPVAKITSVNHPNIATSDSEAKSQGLEAHLMLSVGCKVMLRRNLWVKGGLVNGSVGTIRALIYEDGVTPPQLPLYILVEFDDYTGPGVKNNLFPVIPITISWMTNNIKYARKQFPLTLAHAITIHKCQGLTINKAVLDIGDKEFASGLAYVALSRVRKLTDLLFQPMPKFSRLNATSERPDYLSKQDFVQWLKTLC